MREVFDLLKELGGEASDRQIFALAKEKRLKSAHSIKIRDSLIGLVMKSYAERKTDKWVVRSRNYTEPN